MGGLQPRGALLGNPESNVYVRSGPPMLAPNQPAYLPFNRCQLLYRGGARMKMYGRFLSERIRVLNSLLEIPV